MKLKLYLFGFFTFLFLLLIPKNINASDVKFCKYENISLALPVTVGVKVSAINSYFPFDEIKNLSYDINHLVYDKASCNSDLEIPYIDEKEYYISYNYYYSYNGDIINSSIPLKYGTFQIADLTPPNFQSQLNPIVANVDTYIELDKLTSFVSAYDQVEGSIIPEIIYDNYSDNFDSLGTYSVIYQACDSSNNCSKFTQTIEVVDTTPPTISGIDNLIIYMSNPLSLMDIASKLTAFDNYEKDISHKIILESSNINYQCPGIYYAYYGVKDNSNNDIVTPYKVKIGLIDDIAPSIEGPSLFTSVLSSPLSTSTILSNLTIYDNIDTQAYKNIYILNDDYSTNSTKIGTYTLTVGTYDKYGNESTPYLITISVIDDIAPTIDGIKEYTSYLSSPISILNIKSNLIVQDNHDGNLFNSLEIIEDTYSNNSSNIGVTYIIFIVKDKSGNQSPSFKIEITSYDDVAPIIDGPNFHSTLTNEKIDPISIKLSLTAIDNIDGDVSGEIIINEDTYSDNYNKPGDYYLTFYVVDKSGNFSTMFKVKISVEESLRFIDMINDSYIYFDTTEYRNDTLILDILGINSNEYLNISTLENNYATSYNITGNYTIIFELQHLDYTKETLTININTYDIPNTSKKLQTETTSSEKKKETIFSKIISFFKNLLVNISSFFKKLFN